MVLQLTRKEMSEWLLCLKGYSCETPLMILQRILANSRQGTPTSLPSIFEKLMKKRHKDIGLSLNEIVALGNQIEHTQFSAGAVQNWVKRDMKDWVGTPQVGKKYGIEQVAILFIIDDLKATLDFESIRKLFSLIFNNPHDYDDDLIRPLNLYASYSSIFEELDINNDQVLDNGGTKHNQRIDRIIHKKVRDKIQQEQVQLSAAQREALVNTMVIAILSVQSSYFQSLSKRYLHAILN